MRSTRKKSTAQKRREARPMHHVHMLIPQDVHRIVTEVALKSGKATSHMYRELIEAGLEASA